MGIGIGREVECDVFVAARLGFSSSEVGADLGPFIALFNVLDPLAVGFIRLSVGVV
jgi:hypothetical protein